MAFDEALAIIKASGFSEKRPSIVTSVAGAARVNTFIDDNNHLTLTEISQRFQISERTLRKVRYQKTARRDTWSAIAKGMGVSLENLLKQ